MEKDLTSSRIDRENILNNGLALKEIENILALKGTPWRGTTWYTKDYAAHLYQVDIRTIENQVSKNFDELTNNGYIVLTSSDIQDFKQFAPEMNFGSKTRNLAIFSFKALLNLAMLIQNSEPARKIRSRILDIVLNVISVKTGGQRMYINQRDATFLDSAYESYKSRKEFTQVLNDFVDMGMYKYEYFTNQIYKAIFLENARKYQQELRLKNRSNLRDTMYSEVLTNIASVESGIAYDIEETATKLHRMLTKEEVDDLILKLTHHPSMKIYIDQARAKMASRDLCFRDAYHAELQDYISSVNPDDFERFLGEKSKSLEKQIEEHIDVFKRLKDK